MSTRAAISVGITLTCMLTLVDDVSGQSRPREPLAPGVEHYLGSLPQRESPPREIVQADVIRIRNIGNAELGLVYWNGEGKWNELTVASAKSVDFSCTKCGSQVTIQFHNGKEIRKLEVEQGKVYLLHWSEAKREWDLSPAKNPPVDPRLRDRRDFIT